MQILPTVRQVEFYLSPANLPYDTHLNHHIDPDGWFPLALIVTYPRMQKLRATDPVQVAIVLRVYSTLVLVDSTALRIRPTWHYLPDPALYEPQLPISPQLQLDQQEQQPQSQSQQRYQYHHQPHYQQQQQQQQPIPPPHNLYPLLYPATFVMYPVIPTHHAQPFPPLSTAPPHPHYYSSPPSPSLSHPPSVHTSSTGTSFRDPFASRSLRRRRRFAKPRNYTPASPRSRPASPHIRSVTTHQPHLINGDFPPLNASPPLLSLSNRLSAISTTAPVKQGWISAVKAGNGVKGDISVQHVGTSADCQVAGKDEGEKGKKEEFNGERRRETLSVEPKEACDDVVDTLDECTKLEDSVELAGGEGDGDTIEVSLKRAVEREDGYNQADLSPRDSSSHVDRSVRADVSDNHTKQSTTVEANAMGADLREVVERDNEPHKEKAVMGQRNVSEGVVEKADVPSREVCTTVEQPVQAVHGDDLPGFVSPSKKMRESTLPDPALSGEESASAPNLLSPKADQPKISSVRSLNVWANAPRSLFTPPPTPSASSVASPRPKRPLQFSPRVLVPPKENPKEEVHIQGGRKGAVGQWKGRKAPNNRQVQSRRSPTFGGNASSPRIRDYRNGNRMQHQHARRRRDGEHAPVEERKPVEGAELKSEGADSSSHEFVERQHRDDGPSTENVSKSLASKAFAVDQKNAASSTRVTQTPDECAYKDQRAEHSCKSESDDTIGMSKAKDANAAKAPKNGKSSKEPLSDQPRLQVQVASVAKVTPMTQPSNGRLTVSMSATSQV